MPNINFDRPRVAMIQDGARNRYTAPLALQNANILERVFIDWFVRRASMEALFASLVTRINPKLGKRMSERACPEFDPRRIVRNPALALKLRLKMPKFPTSEDSFIWASRQTARWIIRQGFGDANILYGFIRNAAPEAYQAARAQGLRTCGDQMIAPLAVEHAEMNEQIRRWPGWIAAESASLHQDYLRFEQQTWERLDQITCASTYVRDGLVSAGIPLQKITVIPYPCVQDPGAPVRRERKPGPLVVGFVGAVGLRKGAPYFLEVARRFDPRKFKFVMVGKVLLNPEKLAPYQDHVEFTGPVARSSVRDRLGQFDIFFFPSTCEGSAGAVMEAMAGGLPVLTTPNSGSVARDGVDGFIFHHDQIEKFESAIRQLDEDRDLLRRMGQSARMRALSYDLPAYARDLLNCFTNLLHSSKTTEGSQAAALLGCLGAAKRTQDQDQK